MEEIKNKKTEVVTVITSSEEMALQIGKFLGKPIVKAWNEDFVDEDTGETVTIERKEILYDRAMEITPTLISELLFHLQAGSFKEIVVSNQRRAAYESRYGTKIYQASAEIGPKAKKNKFLFSATSIPVAIEILKDYIELNFIGGYRIISIKEFQTSLLLEDKLKEKGSSIENDDLLNEEKYYHITALVLADDGFEQKANVVAKTLDLDKALLLLNNRLKETNPKVQFTVKLEEAKLLTVDHIIEDEFVFAYNQETPAAGQ